MTLTSLVAQDKWVEFDDAWSELIGSKGPTDELFAALRIAAEKKRIPRCIPQVRLHVEALDDQGRHEEAARLLGFVVSTGASAGELAPLLLEQAQKTWGAEPWFAKYAEIAGLVAGLSDARKPWSAFERLLGFGQGRLVYHPGGWGTGEVTELHADTLEISVRFANGRRDRFPLAAASDIFDPLAEDDLRAQHFRDADALKKKLRDDPLDVLKSVVVRHGGKASVAGIKNALCQVGVDGSAWTAWWRKARKLAENSEWFKVTGVATRGDVALLRTAVDPATDLRRELEGYATLEALLAQVRNQLLAKPDERLRNVMFEVIEKRAGQTGTRDPLSIRLSAWMLLRDEREEPPAALLEHARAVAAQPAPQDPNLPPPLWKLFQSIPGAKEQERAVLLLQDLFGDAWPEEALKNLHHAAPGMVRALVDALAAKGRRAELGALYRELLARPLRAPETLIALARLGEAGKLQGELPPAPQRAVALLALATNLYVARDSRGDTVAARTKGKLTELLTKGKEPLLARLLATAEPATIESIQRTIQRGVDEEIEAIVAEFVVAVPATGARGGAPHFWENERTWTTKKGLEKRAQEFKHLREVKIPANQDAIGRAAAMGDLSENAEWEAAIEEQRTLTSRAMAMETELRSVELIENAILLEGVVSPGTHVRYREAKSGAEHEITILGPWDMDQGEQVVSYRAPLAQGLLGRRAGDRVVVNLPGGDLDVEVVEIRAHHLD
ncbi:MAG: GreA/GreB family elongation factor [Planctomycetes bacterium]|nr:GreA/GreB family elongation factor [Planctomycetota bacterium]